ncbi:MAG TPA: hypothetical protein VM582_02670 [Candidatus Thermoplasmatota archaeon]|nr:hypothetical protein [Candidatus Thermoplasmatota archaeon]
MLRKPLPALLVAILIPLTLAPVVEATPALDSDSCTTGVGVHITQCAFRCRAGERLSVTYRGYFGFVTADCGGAHAACDINPVTNGLTTTTCQSHGGIVQHDDLNGRCQTGGGPTIGSSCFSG